MDPTARLRIATRIHFALLRQFGEGVDIRALLAGGPEGREAIWVCEASGDPELVELARQFARNDAAGTGDMRALAAAIMPSGPSAAVRRPR